MVKKCDGCDETKKLSKDKARDFYLCSVCKESIEYKLICKSHIKNEYFITEKEMEGCEFFIIERGRFPDMTLYALKDVIDRFALNYDIDSKNMNAINRKKDELQNIKTQKQIERKKKSEQKKKLITEHRKKELVKALDEYGLKLRNDSKLCNGYIDGSIKDWSIDGIVERMCQMKYLYDYCNMDECYDEAYEEQQEEYEAGYYPDCSVFEQAEMIALEKYGNKGKYPEEWPWLEYE
jgi:hypothetical protein